MVHCSSCNSWYHINCVHVPKKVLQENKEPLYISVVILVVIITAIYGKFQTVKLDTYLHISHSVKLYKPLGGPFLAARFGPVCKAAERIEGWRFAQGKVGPQYRKIIGTHRK